MDGFREDGCNRIGIKTMGAAQEVKAQQAEARMEGTRPNEAFAPKIRASDDGK